MSIIGGAPKASVFISHSTKDTAPAPGPGADDAALARWQRLQVARALREAIMLALEKLAGVEVWLDKRELQPGVLWRDALHEQLARCDGAVLLLTPEALESGWVLKEVTILTWLQALGFKVRLVPVFLGIRHGRSGVARVRPAEPAGDSSGPGGPRSPRRR
ncbi:MAG: toll/interleukin-1 receptor domain-containing protein [Pseudonocardiaceae bacterium]